MTSEKNPGKKRKTRSCQGNSLLNIYQGNPQNQGKEGLGRVFLKGFWQQCLPLSQLCHTKNAQSTVIAGFY